MVARRLVDGQDLGKDSGHEEERSTLTPPRLTPRAHPPFPRSTHPPAVVLVPCRRAAVSQKPTWQQVSRSSPPPSPTPSAACPVACWLCYQSITVQQGNHCSLSPLPLITRTAVCPVARRGAGAGRAAPRRPGGCHEVCVRASGESRWGAGAGGNRQRQLAAHGAWPANL